MSFPSDPYSNTIKKVSSVLSTDLDNGLDSDEIRTRVEKYGPNTITDRSERTAFKILFNQFTNILTYILLGAILLSIISDHHIDALIITFLLFVNIAIGFVLEYRAEKRMDSLKEMIEHNCRVIRDGKEMLINTEDLVPGDIVKVEDGDAVPADLRLSFADELSADESALTGESKPIQKSIDPLPKGTVLADRVNMLFTGTFITFGVGKGVVVATGEDTELGKISEEIEGVNEEKSLFHKRTEDLMKKMIMISFTFAVITVLILYIRGAESEEILQFSFAALISGIPEGLPSILTVLLSIASVRLAKHNALLRNLPAIETLSTTTTIITDKTGTLTENVMSVNQVLLSNGDLVEVSGEGWNDKGVFKIANRKIDPKENDILYRALEYCSFSSSGDAVKKEDDYELVGYPTEIARYLLSKKGGLDLEKGLERYEVLDSDPYSQESKFKSLLVKEKKSGKLFLFIVGGAEKVLKLSKSGSALLKYTDDKAAQGFRMQAIAHKEVKFKKISDVKFSDLTPLAVLQIADPIRKRVPNAIKQAKRAGIRVIMATGDHLSTAFAVARETGIIPRDADQNDILKYAVSENEIKTMSDQEFTRCVSSINVFARVTPSTKIRIAKELHLQGEILAMTGDGVNDAPVLKQADIGIAMGRNGTELAKESSDLVLTDDSFATIIDAIKEGRTVFRNMKRTSLYLITTNLSEDLLILLAILLGMPLPLLPIQILWLNLVTDGVTDIALATEKPHENILLKRPAPVAEGIVRKQDILIVGMVGTIMAIIAISFFLRYQFDDIDKARSMAFTAMVFTQLFNVINMRSLSQPIWELGYFSNRALNYAILASVIIFFTAMSVPFIRDLFNFTQLTFKEIITIIAISSSILIAGEVYKYSRRRWVNPA